MTVRPSAAHTARPHEEKARRPYTPRMPAAERREQLLDAALTMIVRDGYRAVSIDAIARELDVTRPVVYNLYDSIEPLLYALLDRQAKRALTAVASAVLTAGITAAPTSAQTRALIAELVAMVANDPSSWSPIFMTPTDAPAVVRERIQRDRDIVRKQFKAILDASLSAHRSKTTKDTDMLSHALMGIAEYFGRLIVTDPAGVDRDRIADSMSDLIRAALS